MVIKLLFQILEFKLSALANLKKKTSTLIIFVLLAIASLVNADIVSRLFNNELIIDNIENPVAWLFVLFSFLTIIRKLFPNFQYPDIYIQYFYPVSSLTRYIVNISGDFFSIYFFNAIFFFVLIHLKVEYLDGLFILKFIIVLISSIVIRRSIQTIIAHKLDSVNPIIIIVFMLFINFFIIIQNTFFQIELSLIIQILGVLSLILLGTIIETSLIYETKNISIFFSKNIWLNIIKLNKTFKISTIFALLIKTLFLIVITILYINKHKYPQPVFIVYLFFLPTVLFTYSFNNIWGMNRNIWLCLDLTGVKWTKTILIILKLMTPFLIIDFIVSLTFLLFNPTFLFNGLLSYLMSFFIFFSFSMYWSIFFPIYLKQGFNLKSNTSVVASLISGIVAISFSLVELSYWFWVLSVLLLLLAIFAYLFLNNVYVEYRINIYEKLFKGYLR